MQSVFYYLCMVYFLQSLLSYCLKQMEWETSCSEHLPPPPPFSVYVYIKPHIFLMREKTKTLEIFKKSFIAKKANYIVSNLLWFLRTHIFFFIFTSETCDSSLKPLGRKPKHMLEANLRLILLLKGNIHILYPDFLAGWNQPSTPKRSEQSKPGDNLLFHLISKIQQSSPRRKPRPSLWACCPEESTTDP